MRLDARHIACAGTLLVLGPGCLRPRRVDYADLVRASSTRPFPGRRQGVDPAVDEAALAGEPRLASMLRLALARNPGVLAARARVEARAAGVPAAGRSPDPELFYELRGAPLGRPWAMDQADSHMLGLRQLVPAPGTLDARSRAELAATRLTLEEQHAIEQDVVRDVRRAYWALYAAERERGIRGQHAELLDRIVELARAGYEAGRGSQQEIIRLAVEGARLRSDLAIADQEIESTRALLNTLMGRPLDAPIGPVPELDRDVDVEVDVEVDEQRPEIASRRYAIEAGEARLDEARHNVRWPSLMLEADYMYMPTMEEEPHRYGVMLSINLPWLNPARREEVERAEKEVGAERLALESTRSAARYEARLAEARATAARKTYDILDRELTARAQQSFDAALAAYAAGAGDAVALLDAQRALLEVSLERIHARADLAGSLADLERATGGSAAQETGP